MSHESPNLDINLAHRHFAADCFNRTWELIQKPTRTSAEDEAMVLAALSSLWHWTQRPDCTPRNLSIGHWQVSRVYALLGQGGNAMRHALRSIELAEGSSPFYMGYAHEAAARAALLLKDFNAFRMHLNKARSYAAAVADSEDQAPLDADLSALESAGRSSA
jgi:hypothetical protein